MVEIRMGLSTAILVALLAACGTSSSDPADAAADAGGDLALDVAPDTASDAASDAGLDLPSASGQLCGPKPRPCTLHRSEVVSAKLERRFGGPTLNLDAQGRPSIFYTGQTPAALARRQGSGQWKAYPLPNVATRGSYVEAGGAGYAMIYDGTIGGVYLYRRGTTGWTKIEKVASDSGGWANALALDKKGRLHTPLTSGQHGEDLSHGVWDKTWTLKSINGKFITARNIPLKLAADETPHLAFWRQGSGGWELAWSDTAAVEVVSPPGLSGEATALAVGSGQPHILFERPKGTSNSTYEVVYAHRAGASSWSSTAVASGISHQMGGDCSGAPTAPNQTCTYDQVGYRPIDVVVDKAGEVRLLLARVRHFGSGESTCTYNPLHCSWSVKKRQTQGSLEIAWPAGASVTRVTLLAAVNIDDGHVRYDPRGTARLDAAGRIHLAIYDNPGGHKSTRVRYLVFGPGS